MTRYPRTAGKIAGIEQQFVATTCPRNRLASESVIFAATSRCESPFPLVKSGLVLKCAVEQRLARQAHNLEVVGSIPTGATSFSHSCDRSKPPAIRGFFHAPADMSR